MADENTGGKGARLCEKIYRVLILTKINPIQVKKVFIPLASNLCMEKRAEVLISGRVQGVGFRDFVAEIARELQIRGYVENLESGDVKIVGEADEKIIKKIINEIKAAESPIKVANIKVSYSPSQKEFALFKIKTGDLAQEMIEGFGTGKRYLQETEKRLGDRICGGVENVGRKVENVGRKVDKVGEKVNEVGEKVGKVGEKIDKFSGQTHSDFGHMDTKYGEISKTMKEIKKIVDRYAEQGDKDRKLLAEKLTQFIEIQSRR